MIDGYKLVKILLVYFLDMNQKVKFSFWSLGLSLE